MREKLVYSVEDLRKLLPLGRGAAYRLANVIGVRVGRKLMVPRARLDDWLARGESLPVENNDSGARS
jgi:hypothetical protein